MAIPRINWSKVKRLSPNPLNAPKAELDNDQIMKAISGVKHDQAFFKETTSHVGTPNHSYPGGIRRTPVGRQANAPAHESATPPQAASSAPSAPQYVSDLRHFFRDNLQMPTWAAAGYTKAVRKAGINSETKAKELMDHLQAKYDARGGEHYDVGISNEVKAALGVQPKEGYGGKGLGYSAWYNGGVRDKATSTVRQDIESEWKWDRNKAASASRVPAVAGSNTPAVTGSNVPAVVGPNPPAVTNTALVPTHMTGAESTSTAKPAFSIIDQAAGEASQASGGANTRMLKSGGTSNGKKNSGSSNGSISKGPSGYSQEDFAAQYKSGDLNKAEQYMVNNRFNQANNAWAQYSEALKSGKNEVADSIKKQYGGASSYQGFQDYAIKGMENGPGVSDYIWGYKMPQTIGGLGIAAGAFSAINNASTGQKSNAELYSAPM